MKKNNARNCMFDRRFINCIIVIVLIVLIAVMGNLLTDTVLTSYAATYAPEEGVTLKQTYSMGECTLKLYSNNVGVISGGANATNPSGYTPPWKSSGVTTVYVEDEVLSLGNNLFNGVDTLTEVNLGTNTVKIGDSCFPISVNKVYGFDSVKEVGAWGFRGVINDGILDISNIEVLGDNPSFGMGVYESVKLGNKLNTETTILSIPNSNYYDISDSNIIKVNECLYSADGKNLLKTEYRDSTENLTLLDSCIEIKERALDTANYKNIIFPDRKLKIHRQYINNLDNLEIPNASIKGPFLNQKKINKLTLGNTVYCTNWENDSSNNTQTFYSLEEINELRTGSSLNSGYNNISPKVKINNYYIDSSNTNGYLSDKATIDTITLENGNFSKWDYYRLNWTFENLDLTQFEGKTLPNNIGKVTGMTDTKKYYNVIGMADNIEEIGDYSLAYSKLDMTDLDIKSVGNYGLSYSNVESVTVTDTVGTNAFQGATNLKKAVLNTAEAVSTNAFIGCNSLSEIYWFGDVATNSKKADLPTAAMIYCEKGSRIETWCKNNSVAYEILSEEDIEDIVNGKRPSVIDNSVLFDRQDPQDKNFIFDLGTGKLGAKSIKSISINGSKVAFTVLGNTFTLSEDVLQTLPVGTHNIIVEFNNGYIISNKASITVVGSAVVLPPEMTVPEQTAIFDKDDAYDIKFTVYCNSIDNILINNRKLLNSEYTLMDKTLTTKVGGNINNPKVLTIKSSVLKNLKPGEYKVILITEGVTIKDKLLIFVTGEEEGSQEPPVILETIKYEFYKDYPDYVVIPFSFNRATSITDISIESNTLGSTDYQVEKNTIVLDKNYLSTLDVGKYRVSITFDDGTIRSNVQLIIYNKAADRAAPYLLQSRVVFTGSSIVLNFDPGEGELQATNVLALVLDDKMILPNGDLLPFTSTNVKRVQKAFLSSLDDKDDKESIASPSDATEIDKDEDILDEDVEVASPSNLTSKDNTSSTKKSRTKRADAQLMQIMVDLQYSSNNVFTVSGNEIILEGKFIDSLNLVAGDYLLGAVFDNTEKTTDLKKVILTIESDKPEVPDIPDKPEIPDVPDKPEIPDVPDKPEIPDVPDKPNNGGGNTGGGSGGGSGTSTKPIIPDTGGNWEGSGDDWEYIKPDGSHAKDEWVGDGFDWYYIDENSKLKYDWFLFKDNNWYMLNREHNGKFGAALRDWYYEKQDGCWYYLDKTNNSMLTGWQYIGGKYYYLTPVNEGPTYFGDNISGWKYDSTKQIRPYGSMYINEKTPDGYTVDSTGSWVR